MKNPINKMTRSDVATFDAMRNASTSNSLDLYQRMATKSAKYPGQGSPLGLIYCSLKLNGEAGELAEHVGKAMRDDALITAYTDTEGYGDIMVNLDAGELTKERRKLIIKEVGDVLWYLSAICNELNLQLSKAALINIEKLCDRDERDALQGSGDDR